LGNTQYEHYNKTGIDVDKLLEKKGATRIYKLGLGDDNCSLEDDYSEWRKSLWPALKNFRRSNPLEEKKEEKVEKKIIRKMSFED
jgi:sulfite reductase alpha subunit-like flavoprotein